MVKENRKSKRWPMHQDAKLRELGSERFLDCLLCDISFGGAKVSSRARFEEGVVIETYMHIPDMSRVIMLKAKVVNVWPRPLCCYEYGLQFLELSQPNKNKIYEYIYKNYPSEFRKSQIRNGQRMDKGGENTMYANTPQEDRRIFARIPVDLLARYVDSNSYNEGYFSIKDVSAKGIGVASKKKFGLNTSLEIWVSVPNQTTPIYTRGEVVWERPDPSGKGYHVGISLDKADLMNFPAILKC